MKQIYEQYTAEDLEVWNILFERQHKNLQDKGSAHFLENLKLMKDVLNAEKVPDFKELDEVLLAHTGWSIEVVEGLIPVEDFFQLLANKKFCSSTWLRSKDQLDYLEEPDMFHDIFGHIPMFLNEEFAQFTQNLGKLGCRHIDNPTIIKQLERIYWFTIEFGLIREQGKVKTYGAGIMSSFGETNHIFNDPIETHPFIIEEILEKSFTTSEIQQEYFVIESVNELFRSIEKLEKLLQVPV